MNNRLSVGQRAPRPSNRAFLILSASLKPAIVAAVVALMLAACGTAPSIALSLDSAQVEVLRGTQQQVTVTLTRTGEAQADVSLSVTGAPAEVTASFSPVTLTGSILTSVLTLSAPASAAAGTHDLSIVGTATGLTTNIPLTLEVTDLTVSGRVLALNGGAPVAGASVMSQGDSSVTAADGTFTLSGLATPYELSVWNTAQEWVHSYLGLTATELELYPMGATSSLPPYFTQITGSLSGGAIPIGSDSAVIVCVEGLGGIASGCTSVANPDTAYTLDVNWLGEPSREVRLHAIQVEKDASGFAVGYQGYTSVDLTVDHGEPADVPLDLGSDLDTANVTITLSGGTPNTMAALQVSPGLAIPLMAVASPAASFDLTMPVIPDTSYGFLNLASFNQLDWHFDVTGDSASLTVPEMPTLIAPAEGATDVTVATNFSATNPAGGPTTFQWLDTVGDLRIALTTMESSAQIPDLTDFGLSLPDGGTFQWGVVVTSGNEVEAMSDAVQDAGGAIRLAFTGWSWGATGKGTLANSAPPRSFTTAILH